MQAQRGGRGLARGEGRAEKKRQRGAAFGCDLKPPQLREGGFFRPAQHRAACSRLQRLLDGPKGLLR